MAELGWSNVSEAYARSFATLCAGPVATLLNRVAPALGTPDAVVLDVGSGTGTVAREARRRNWRALALDPDGDMATLTDASLRHLDDDAFVTRAALPALPITAASVDAVVANFVINHVDDPRAALTEMVRVLRPGGRVAMTIWTAGGAGWAELVNRAFEDAGAVSMPARRLAPHLDFERTPDGLAAISAEAGLHVLTSETTTWHWRVRSDDLWAGIAGGVAAAGARYLAQESRVRSAVRDRFEEVAAEHSTGGVLDFVCEAALAVGTRPA